MLPIFIISYFQSYNVKSNDFYFATESFKFLNGATFEVKIQSSKNDYLLVGLATLDEMAKIKTLLDTYSGINCSEIKKYFNIFLSTLIKIDENRTGNYQGKIDSDSILNPIIITCINYSAQNRLNLINHSQNETNDLYISDYIVTFNFNGPVTFVNTHKALFLIIPVIVASLFGIIFILWLINWFRYFSLSNYLHICFALNFLVCLVYLILYALECWYLFNKKQSKPFSTATKAFQYIDEILFIAMMHLICLDDHILFPPAYAIAKFVISLFLFGYALVTEVFLLISLRKRNYITLLGVNIAILLYDLALRYMIFDLGSDVCSPKANPQMRRWACKKIINIISAFAAGIVEYCSVMLLCNIFLNYIKLIYIKTTLFNFVQLILVAILAYTSRLSENYKNVLLMDMNIEKIKNESELDEIENKPPITFQNGRRKHETNRNHLIDWNIDENEEIQ